MLVNDVAVTVSNVHAAKNNVQKSMTGLRPIRSARGPDERADREAEKTHAEYRAERTGL